MTPDGKPSGVFVYFSTKHEHYYKLLFGGYYGINMAK